MRYTIKCEKCGRPGDIEKQTTTTNNYQQPTRTNTTYKNTCDCGGKIKVIWD